MTMLSPFSTFGVKGLHCEVNIAEVAMLDSSETPLLTVGGDSPASPPAPHLTFSGLAATSTPLPVQVLGRQPID